ncbi:hypothetical protein [Streptomyces sp. SID4985]|nr:hypothetical protein [Streptomyces sp. SID4985]
MAAEFALSVSSALPSLDEDYAVRIARDWNVKHDSAGEAANPLHSR